MTLGEELREIRKKRGLSQRELADKVGLKYYQRIGQYETNKRKPRYDSLKKIAETLKCGFRYDKDGKPHLYEFRDVDTTQEAQEASRERAKATMDYHAIKRETATLKEQLDDNFNAVPIEGKRKITGYSEDIKKAYQTQK